MDFKSFDQTRIHYEHYKAKGPLLVFIHGWGVNWTTWKKEIMFFRKQGYSTLHYDIRGHGKSGSPIIRTAYNMTCHVRDLNALMTLIKKEKAIIIGHSMGGMIAIKYYEAYPSKVQALILCSTSAENMAAHKKAKKLSPLVKKSIDFMMGKQFPKRKPKEIDFSKQTNFSSYYLFLKGVNNMNPQAVLACLDSMLEYDESEAVKKVNVPVLIISGGQDNLLPEIYSVEMFKRIKHAKLITIPGKHFITLEKPQIVSEKILGFLEKISK